MLIMRPKEYLYKRKSIFTKYLSTYSLYLFFAVSLFKMPRVSVLVRLKLKVIAVFENIPENRLSNNIVLIVILLMAIGTVFVFSASVNISEDIELNSFFKGGVFRQIVFFPVSILIIYLISNIDYQTLKFSDNRYRSLSVYLLIVSVLLLIVVTSQRFFPVLPQLVPKINQHYRWLKIPVAGMKVSFQPSEMAKWATIFFLCAFCERYRDRLGDYWKKFVPMCAVVGVVCGLVIIEDFGTAFFIAVISLLIFIFSGVKIWHILTLVPPPAKKKSFTAILSTLHSTTGMFCNIDQHTDRCCR